MSILHHPFVRIIGGSVVGGGMISERLVAILCVVVVVWWGLFRWKRRHLYRLASQLPGPPTLPIFGNLFQLMFDPKDFSVFGLKFCLNQPSLFRLWFGPFLYVVVYEPEDAQIILNSSAALGKGMIYNLLKNTFGDGLLTAPVHKWKKNRRLISPAFNSRMLEHFLRVFNNKTRVMGDLLEKELGGGSFDVYKYCELLDLDIICETSLGFDVQAQTEPPCREFIDAVSSASHIITVRALNFWMHPNVIYKWTSLCKRENRDRDVIHRLAKQLLEQKKEEYHKKKLAERNGPAETDYVYEDEKRMKNILDIVTSTMEGEGLITESEVIDEITTILLAGSETSAITNSFCLLMLGMYQDIQEKVYDEIRRVFGDSDRDATIEDLNQLVYLEQVIRETLRRWPLVPTFVRNTTEDIQLTKYKIPAGSSVIIPSSVVHLRRDIYPDPYKFDPDRFSPENVASRHKYSFMAFGGGPRACIGYKFAMLSMKTTLVIILRRYKIYSDIKMRDIKVTVAVTSRAVDGYPIRIEERTAGEVC